MLGASFGTINVVTPIPLLTPLFVTPGTYASPVPVVGAVFIQNGCPGAETLNVYFEPLVSTMVRLFWPLMTYAPVPELVTVYCVDAVADTAGVTIL